MIKKDTLNEKKLNSAFKWFENAVKPLVLQTFCDFWEDEFEIELASISTCENIKKDFFAKNESYFVCKAQINKQQNVITRLSSKFTKNFLEENFGKSEKDFSLMNLTDLEIKIVNKFANCLYESLKCLFIPYKNLQKQYQNDKVYYNLGFFVKKNEGKVSKFLISIPRNAVSPQPIELKDSFDFEDFETSRVSTKICVGKTKITLNDLKNIQNGDIMLLEQSVINSLKIKIGDISIPFKSAPNPLLYMDINENEHDIQGGNMSKNIWDEIPIEVSAEFHKVKMSLGELKKITEGMVVDLGDVFNNKISLVVEDKTVARGDLVIINDKYGVKIDEIVNEKQDKEIVPQIKAQEAKQAPPVEAQPQPPVEIEDEDFDYTNFEDDIK